MRAFWLTTASTTPSSRPFGRAPERSLACSSRPERKPRRTVSLRKLERSTSGRITTSWKKTLRMSQRPVSPSFSGRAAASRSSSRKAAMGAPSALAPGFRLLRR